jgi:hypothetical protein
MFYEICDGSGAKNRKEIEEGLAAENFCTTDT